MTKTRYCARLMLAAFCAVAVSSRTVKNQPTTQTFEIDIEEAGTAFTEQITIDEDKNTETIFVPSYNSVAGATYIHDFNLNLTLRREVDSGRCFLSDLSKEIQDGSMVVPRQMLAALKSEEGSGQIFQTVAYTWVYGELVSDEVRNRLGREMRELCDGQIIQYLNRLHDNVNIHEVSDEHYDDVMLHSRPTRHVSCNKEYQKMRCITHLRHCRYVVTCEKDYAKNGKSFNECRKHVYDRVVCCTNCCSDKHRSDPHYFPYCATMCECEVKRRSSRC